MIKQVEKLENRLETLTANIDKDPSTSTSHPSKIYRMDSAHHILNCDSFILEMEEWQRRSKNVVMFNILNHLHLR